MKKQTPESQTPATKTSKLSPRALKSLCYASAGIGAGLTVATQMTSPARIIKVPPAYGE